MLSNFHKQVNKLAGLAALAAGLLGWPAFCLAQTSLPKPMADFSLVYQNQAFSPTQNEMRNWRQPSLLEQSSPILYRPPQPENLLAEFAGLPAAESDLPAATSSDYNPAPIYDFISSQGPQINRAAVAAQLTVDNNRASNFVPPQNGQILDTYQSTLLALVALSQHSSSSSLAVITTPPVTSLAQTNSLGINQLIAHGVSSFKGSPKNRRHNIAAGIEKFRGLLIAPGQTFSFDDNLGPVTDEAGFVPELVIDNGTTQPELGGGLCQVSTTTFRAAMAAGLPITARRNHAYAVQYYAPQGTDATIYPGSADLKFVNDTPGTILIWPYEADSNTLVFDFYGSSDGRQVALDKPAVYDRKPDGSMKATWTRVVTAASGQIRTDVFKSNYQPPALFHKTEEFINAASSSPGSLLSLPPVQAKTQ